MPERNAFSWQCPTASPTVDGHRHQQHAPLDQLLAQGLRSRHSRRHLLRGARRHHHTRAAPQVPQRQALAGRQADGQRAQGLLALQPSQLLLAGL